VPQAAIGGPVPEISRNPWMFPGIFLTSPGGASLLAWLQGSCF
jgi:hypothetical protein